MPHAEGHHVKATLNYYLDPAKGGYESFWFGTVGEKRRPFEYVEVPITDIRGREEEFQLDVHGFEYVKESSKLTPEDTDSHERIKQVYYGECEELLKRLTGGSRVHIMGHVCRKSNWDKFAEATKDKEDMERTPIPTSARYVHVDHSYAGAETRLHFYLPHEAPEILSRKKRWAIINIWRPIYPVTRENLAFLDASSIPDTSLRPIIAKFCRPENHEQLSEVTRKAFERNDVETWSVAPPGKGQGEHRWYYCKKMMPEEAIVFKIFDSTEEEGVARRVPHTAFQCDEDFGEDRQSVELRGLVLWDEGGEERAEWGCFRPGRNVHPGAMCHAGVFTDESTPPDLIQASDYYLTPRAQHPNAPNQMLMTSFPLIASFHAYHLVDQLLTQPILLIAGADAGSMWHTDRLDQVLGGATQRLTIPGAGRMDLYDGPEEVALAIRELEQFYG